MRRGDRRRGVTVEVSHRRGDDAEPDALQVGGLDFRLAGDDAIEQHDIGD